MLMIECSVFALLPERECFHMLKPCDLTSGDVSIIPTSQGTRKLALHLLNQLAVSRTNKPAITLTGAMQRALTTTELLEAILAELPPLDVLRAQQVCKYWQDVLQTSTTLQRKLFVKADAREIVQHRR